MTRGTPRWDLYETRSAILRCYDLMERMPLRTCFLVRLLSFPFLSFQPLFKIYMRYFQSANINSELKLHQAFSIAEKEVERTLRPLTFQRIPYSVM
jgi:hypothetical protein